MSDIDTLSKLLSESVIASTARLAERSLKELENQDGFGITLLHVVASKDLPISTRLAGALFFKNFLRRRWVDENGNHLLPLSNVELIKKEIVPLMISLPSNLQVQIGASISIIADSDFPDRWPTLLDDLVSKLSPDDMTVDRGVLTVAHTIFKRWRPLFRSDELFLEIKLVLDKFTVPFLTLLQSVDEQIAQNENNTAYLTALFEVLLLLIKLYYDFNCQDIPEFFEDNIQIGMGILHKYLSYHNTLLEDPNETDEACIVTKVKTSIQELIQLYAARYEDVFGPLISEFIQSTWKLLTSLSDKAKYDILVSKSLAFLTAVSRNPKYFEIFNSEEAMNGVIEQIILPNVTLRESDIELFEDDPIEYIRRDLEGSDADTRRRACTDFLNELREKNNTLVTTIAITHMKKFYEQYLANPKEFWRFKDLYVHLFITLAVNGNITSSGVSSTNIMLNVLEFYNNQIIPDLTNEVPHNILRVDAIKFIYIFRNQLQKDELIKVLPILGGFLNSDEYVVYTYSAITIERVLSIRESNTSPNFIFTKSDLDTSAAVLLRNLINLILKQGTSPEKLAENEFLMKAVLRVLQMSSNIKQEFPGFLTQLIGILNTISKNPSNPRFSHYTFESIGIILSLCEDSALPHIIDIMTPSLLSILSNDVQEFVPYAFQLLAYSVERGRAVPESVRQLAQPILSPPIWELKGTVPAVTRLLKDMVRFDSMIFQDLVPVLGVFQRLIASKAYEVYGFELLEVIMLNINQTQLKPYLKQIAVLLMQRLQSSKTERYVKKLCVCFGMLAICLEPDFVVQFIDGVQDGLFGQIWNTFVLPSIPTLGNLYDRKISLIGVTKFVTTGSLFTEKYSTYIPATIESLTKALTSKTVASSKTDYIDLDNIEEITTFGSSFSKLATIAERPLDPLPDVELVNGVTVYVSQALQKYVQSTSTSFSYAILPRLSEETKLALNQLLNAV